VHVQQERLVALTDPVFFETPFVFMNGHNDFVLSEIELNNLRTYLSHGGFLFASGCCDKPGFPPAWRREMGRVFAGVMVTQLGYDHPIYRAFYKVGKIRCLNQSRDIYLEGLIYQAIWWR